MLVKDSRLLGMLFGILIGCTPSFLVFAENINALNLVLSSSFILMGWKIKGTNGGLLMGLGVGVSLGYLLKTLF